ncbi:MAG TPA: hypothetical protein VNN62_07690 [Methylomirabilota bacterium]|jgi:sensor domain CHASE-containing protein|nr:hypothetical protein [Methylomirabilota bacterium]
MVELLLELIPTALDDTVRAVTQQVKNEITARMDARLKALTRLGARLEHNEPPQQQFWETEVAAYSRDFPGS